MFLRLKGLIYNFCLPLLKGNVPWALSMWAFIISGIVPLSHSAVQKRKSQTGSCPKAVSTGYTQTNTAKTVCVHLCRAGRFASIYTAPHLSLCSYWFSAMVCLLSLSSLVQRVHFGHWDIGRGALRLEDDTELYTFCWWKSSWIIHRFPKYLFVYLFILCVLQSTKIFREKKLKMYLF